MDLYDFDPKGEARARKNYQNHLKLKVARPGMWNGTVVRVSDVIPPKNDRGERFVIEVQLKDDDWKDVPVTGKDEKGKEFAEPQVIEKWVDARVKQPKSPEYQGVYGIFEVAGTLEQILKVREMMAALPDKMIEDGVINYIVAEMLRRSLTGRRCAIDAINTTKAGDGTAEKQYGKVVKFLKFYGTVPDCIKENTPDAILEVAVKRFVASYSNVPHSKTDEGQPGKDSHSAPAPPAPAPTPAPDTALDRAKRIHKAATGVKDTMAKIIAEEYKRSKENAAKMKRDGIAGGTIAHILKEELKLEEPEIQEGFDVLNSMGIIMFPRKDMWKFIDDNPPLTVEEVADFLSENEQARG